MSKRLFDFVMRARRFYRLKRLRRRMLHDTLKRPDVERFHGYQMHILDGPDFYIQYKDFFVRQIYHFTCQRPDPLIIDGGSNIGMSILYFKQLFPQSRIIAFEPDLSVFKILQENLHKNNLSNIKLIHAALGLQKEKCHFLPDGKSGGRMTIDQTGIEVPVERLSDFLDQPVDFLKLNIEGAEWDVLREAAAAGKLKNVRETVIEYHGWPQAGQHLGELLTLLDREGFRYLIHDFDSETCGTSKPPFHLDKNTPWFCLIYANQLVHA